MAIEYYDPNNPGALATNGTNNGAISQTPVTQAMSAMATNPQLMPGTEFNPVLMNPNEQFQQDTGQLLSAGNNTLNTTGANITAPQTQQASTVDANTITSGINANNATYEATKVSDQTPQAEAAKMEVNPLSTVKGQLEALYSDTEPGKVPTWAKGAVTQAEQALADRGLGASSIGAGAITAAIQQSALNIAVQDANTYFQADLSTFQAEQQTNLANLQVRQQAMLSDQAAENAAKQFNASSQSQVMQFQANLVASIQNQNAARVDAMKQFNVNAEVAADQFNATMKHQREQFNSEMQFAIDQSNVLWRRSINTANTAAINAANQTNVMNRYQMSQTAMNNIWQQFRDEAAWIFSASENQKNRDANIAQVANNQAFINSSRDTSLASKLGSFAMSILS